DAAGMVLDRGVAAGGDADLLDGGALLGARRVRSGGVSLLDRRAPLAATESRLGGLDVLDEFFLRRDLGLGRRSDEIHASNTQRAEQAQPDRWQAVAHGF